MREFEGARVLDDNLMFYPTTTLREFKDRNTLYEFAKMFSHFFAPQSVDGSKRKAEW